MRVAPFGAGPATEELRGELHRLAAGLTLPSLAQLIRLLQSDRFERLTDVEIRIVGEYGAIEVGGERFFDQAFSAGKEVAGSLGLAKYLGRELVLDDLLRLRAAVYGANAADPPAARS